MKAPSKISSARSNHLAAAFGHEALVAGNIKWAIESQAEANISGAEDRNLLVKCRRTNYRKLSSQAGRRNARGDSWKTSSKSCKHDRRNVAEFKFEMHKIKINFMCGQYRLVDFDKMHVNGELMIFNLAGETQLTAVTRNISYFERMKPLPESR